MKSIKLEVKATPFRLSCTLTYFLCIKKPKDPEKYSRATITSIFKEYLLNNGLIWVDTKALDEAKAILNDDALFTQYNSTAEQMVEVMTAEIPNPNKED